MKKIIFEHFFQHLYFSCFVALLCNFFVFLLFILRFSSYSTNKTSINKKKDIQRRELSCSASPVLLSAFQPSSGKNPHELDKDEEELWQTTAGLTAVEEISADAAVAAL